MLNKTCFDWAKYNILKGNVDLIVNDGFTPSKFDSKYYLAQIVPNANGPKDFAYCIYSPSGVNVSALENILKLSEEDGEFEVFEYCKTLLSILKSKVCCG